MANPTIGTIICPLMGDLADVRQDKNGKFYYAGEAGIIAPKSASGQKWMRDNAKFDGVDAQPEPQSAVELEQDIEREPTARSGGLLDDLLGSVWGADDD
ncbi:MULTISPECIES: hypothetical protein [unclassified Vibrio]|uniref:hypothetical protein n=1 Tax=unclassified Vibrio TaxID=2614977 RepID=UPI00136125DC|nr:MULTISPECIES: hypothetical protein [unclassified Vibrio]NAW57769.1 hypothetical protein [Vibrio sp. V36_P2S2PM302]NAX28414.1 hypothetical protein [Vibrio sp. V38_P2S17PM301]NAX29582.1 hypothetical protein [Vibrio sp. V37_P2S8PM304]